MLPQPVAAAEQRCFHLAFGYAIALGDVGHGVQIPIPADEHVPFFLIQFAEKVIDGRPKYQIIHAARAVIRRRDALLHFRTELTDKSAALQTAAVTAAVQGNVAGDPGEEGVEVIAWLMGRDRAPCLHVGVIFTLLGRLQIIDDPVGQRAQTAAVFLGGLPDGCLVTPQVQRDDAAVIHGVHLLPVLIEGPSPL